MESIKVVFICGAVDKFLHRDNSFLNCTCKMSVVLWVCSGQCGQDGLIANFELQNQMGFYYQLTRTLFLENKSSHRVQIQLTLFCHILPSRSTKYGSGKAQGHFKINRGIATRLTLQTNYPVEYTQEVCTNYSALLPLGWSERPQIIMVIDHRPLLVKQTS